MAIKYCSLEDIQKLIYLDLHLKDTADGKEERVTFIMTS